MVGSNAQSRSLLGVRVTVMKRYLYVMRSLPHLSSQVQETLDQMLTAAAFDQSVAVLFADDGVWQLKREQDPVKMALKNTAAMFLALEMYDINALYVETESLVERGLGVDDLILPIQLVPRAAINDLLKQYQVLIPG